MLYSSILSTIVQATAVLAASHQVTVGGNQQLIFTPKTVQAAAGDTVQFKFLDQNHTVTSGNPNAGCQPSNQFNSGFVPVAANQGTKPTFTVSVANTNPITVYCAQAQHCQSGMIMVINPTQQGATSLNAYQQLTSKAKTNTPANAVNGGVLQGAQPNAGGATTAKAAKGKATGKAAGAAKAAGGKAAGAAAAAGGKAAGAAKAAGGKAAGAAAAAGGKAAGAAKAAGGKAGAAAGAAAAKAGAKKAGKKAKVRFAQHHA